MIENVVSMPTTLERLASRASQAMKTYSHGRREAIAAIIDYGEALLEGKKGLSNTAFAQWVSDNRLDVGKPWDLQPERTSAMLLARLVLQRKFPLEALESCPRSRPNDIRQWARTHILGLAPKTRAKGEKLKKAAAAVASSPEPLTAAAVAEKAGVGETTALKALALDAKERDLLGAATFSDKSKLTLAKAIEIEKKRLAKSFYAQVQAEVRRIIDASNDFVRRRLAEVEAEREGMRHQLQQKGVFTRQEFRQLQMAVHPDNTASTEVRNRLLDLLVKHELRLLKEA